ncbi:MAG: hypothetical protein M3Y27_13710 [Acidobacteriota bacterium]|nr:hypothetical protein [Acidobacteriota bacterium]
MIARNAGPVERVSIPGRKLPDELALRSSVPVTERMNGIELAHVVGRAVAELRKADVPEMALLSKIVREFSEAWNDLLGECEAELSGAGNVHPSDLPSPWVDVLGNVPVNSLNMVGIEAASPWLTRQLARAASGHVHFKFGQTCGIANVPKVPKNVRAGVNVWVHIPGQRTRRLQLPFVQA